MPIDTNGHLWAFCLSVGQADTTVIVTPRGKLIVFDAAKPDKIMDLLDKIGVRRDEKIDHLIVSHPHYDHYSGAQRLITQYGINHATFSSLWEYSDNKPGYNSLINQLDSSGVIINFLSGYAQYYPDDSPLQDAGTPCLELLGPSNQMIEDLKTAGKINTNHRSIMGRLQWGGFVMLIAADAQMENWAHFDREQMLDCQCNVMRAAHHGSLRGTQFERIERLAPKYVIVSSHPEKDDELPDLVGCAAFTKYAKDSASRIVAVTERTGTIKFDIAPGGNTYDAWMFCEAHDASSIDLQQPQQLTRQTNPTDWAVLLDARK